MNDNELSTGAQVRSAIVRACANGGILDAYQILVRSGLTADAAPGAWEYLARQCERKNVPALEYELWLGLWDANIRSGQSALALAGRALDQDHPGRARYFLKEVFGPWPADEAARLLLAKTFAETTPDHAFALIEAAALSDIEYAVMATDLLRKSDRLRQAAAFVETAIGEFPDDTRLKVRKARILEASNDWPAALSAWQNIADAAAAPRSVARASQARLLLRLERQTEANAVAADLFVAHSGLADRLAVADLLGQTDLIVALLERALWQWRDGDGETDHWRSTGAWLLDRGYLGLLVGLAAQGVPFSDLQKTLLDKSVPDEVAAQIGAGGLAQAALINSPEFMLPFSRPILENLADEFYGSSDPANANILIVNSTLSAGGAERQLLTLVEALIANGVPKLRIHVALFSLVADRGHDHFLTRLSTLGAHVHDLRQMPADNRSLPDLVRREIAVLPNPLRTDVVSLWHLAREIRPGVIHGWQDRAALACGWIGVFQNIDRVVMSARNMQPQRRGDFPRYAAALFQSFCARPNVVFTANSEPGARDYEAWLGLDKGRVVTLGNGIGVGELGVARRPKKRQPESRVVVGGVFRLAANKRPRLWLETVACLKQISNFDIQARIVGSGPFEAEVRALAAALGIDRLDLVQGLDTPAEIYAGIDCLLLMSRIEGTPNVLLEAQARGLPVAACDVGGVKDAMHIGGDSGGCILPAAIEPIYAAERLKAWLGPVLASDPLPRQHFVERMFGVDALGVRAKQLYLGDDVAANVA